MRIYSVILSIENTMKMNVRMMIMLIFIVFAFFEFIKTPELHKIDFYKNDVIEESCHLAEKQKKNKQKKDIMKSILIYLFHV